MPNKQENKTIFWKLPRLLQAGEFPKYCFFWFFGFLACVFIVICYVFAENQFFACDISKNVIFALLLLSKNWFLYEKPIFVKHCCNFCRFRLIFLSKFVFFGRKPIFVKDIYKNGWVWLSVSNKARLLWKTNSRKEHRLPNISFLWFSIRI